MNIEIPNSIIESAGLKEEELKSALAVQLYLQGRLNIEQASQLCGCHQDELTELAAKLQSPAGTKEFDMDEFLSWASHDLKTPLNAIIGFSEVVLNGIDGPVTELQTADLNLVVSSGKYLLVLINQLVEVARLNRGESKTKREFTEIMPLIKESVQIWRQKNPNCDLITSFETQDPSPTFNVDTLDIHHAVKNLLEYAAIYVSAGGQIYFSVEGTATDLTLTIKSTGTRTTTADVNVDATLLRFISQSLLKLNGAELELCQADETGAHIRFIFYKI